MALADLLLFFWTISVFTALVGWCTNSLALWLLFEPVAPWACPPWLGCPMAPDGSGKTSPLTLLRIAGLLPREFQTILRPVFQEEEGRLMLAGGMCGAIGGILPVVLL